VSEALSKRPPARHGRSRLCRLQIGRRSGRSPAADPVGGGDQALQPERARRRVAGEAIDQSSWGCTWTVREVWWIEPWADPKELMNHLQAAGPGSWWCRRPRCSRRGGWGPSEPVVMPNTTFQALPRGNQARHRDRQTIPPIAGPAG